MSGWDEYVTTYILNAEEPAGEWTYGVCRRGAIVDSETGAIWGKWEFEFLDYNMEIEDDNGNLVKGRVNEWTNLIDAWNNEGRTKLFGGIRMNNEKFTLAKFDADREVMYLSGLGFGACIAKSNKVFSIGVFYKTNDPLQTNTGKTKLANAGLANSAVEKCRDKLREIDY